MKKFQVIGLCCCFVVAGFSKSEAKGLDQSDLLVNWKLLSDDNRQKKIEAITLVEIENSNINAIHTLLSSYRQYLTLSQIKTIINFGLKPEMKMQFVREPAFNHKNWRTAALGNPDYHNLFDFEGKKLFVGVNKKFPKKWLTVDERYKLWIFAKDKFTQKKYGNCFFESDSPIKKLLQAEPVQAEPAQKESVQSETEVNSDDNDDDGNGYDDDLD
jgi:hypothetical protein